jgi:hypothetical protein
MQFPFPGMGVLFDLGKLDSDYGRKAWRFFMSQVRSRELASSILVHGDTLLYGGAMANCFCIGLFSPAANLKSIRARFEASDAEFLQRMPGRIAAKPVLEMLPLPIAGTVDAGGSFSPSDQWSIVSAALCRECGWSYTPPAPRSEADP